MAGPRKHKHPASPPRKLTTSGPDRGLTLADYLSDRLAIDRTEAEALVRRGSVYLGRLRVEDPSHVLAAGQPLTIHAAPSSPPPAAVGPAPPVTAWVVHQDPEVIVIDKPAGIASQATRAASAGALDRLVADAIDPSARLLHRLDRDTSGLVMFTRTRTAHRRFAQLLAANQLERTYLAAVWGHWERAEGGLSGSIGRDLGDHRRMAVGPGQPALTRFRLIRRGRTPDGAPVSLLQLDLVTGRTHQIRVHLSHAGHPVCGDALYGSEARPLSRLFLHAHRLAWPGMAPVVAPVPPALAELVG